ncbi:hypothetical protein PTKIN_Ptkin04bG0053600 [Pterospermum kingtungense]
MAFATKLMLLIAFLAAVLNNTDALKQKVARIQFYMHDIVGGPHQTTVRVAGCSNFTGGDPIAAMFGGPYNGSTFRVLGRNPVTKEEREMPVIGGTGKFRLARGYCLARTYSMDQTDVVIGYIISHLGCFTV